MALVVNSTKTCIVTIVLPLTKNDAAGSPMGMQYHGRLYADGVWDIFWYEKNLQGDIIAVYDKDGTKLVSYLYNAWGDTYYSYSNGGGSTAAVNNPFRYRGYYYDVDLGLYYLNSRYYDPYTGRFISPDDLSVVTETPMSLTDKNLYSYCDNNPVMRTDPDGAFWVTTLGIMAIGGLIGSLISAVTSIVSQQALTGDVNWTSVGIATMTGFANGLVAASPLGQIGQMVVGGVLGGASYVADAFANDSYVTIDGACVSIGLGIISGLIGGKGANNKMSLTDTITKTKSTILRESRRANQKYAQKTIAKAIYSRNNSLALSTWSASIRFAFGTTVANFFSFYPYRR